MPHIKARITTISAAITSILRIRPIVAAAKLVLSKINGMGVSVSGQETDAVSKAPLERRLQRMVGGQAIGDVVSDTLHARGNQAQRPAQNGRGRTGKQLIRIEDVIQAAAQIADVTYLPNHVLG